MSGGGGANPLTMSICSKTLGGGDGGGDGEFGGGETRPTAKGLPWSSYVVADLSAAVCGTVQLAYVWHQLVYSV